MGVFKKKKKSRGVGTVSSLKFYAVECCVISMDIHVFWFYCYFLDYLEQSISSGQSILLEHWLHRVSFVITYCRNQIWQYNFRIILLKAFSSDNILQPKHEKIYFLYRKFYIVLIYNQKATESIFLCQRL